MGASWRIAKRAFLPITALTFWISVVFLPKDIKDLPKALRSWEPLMPDQNTVLIWFSGLLVLWILVRDVRPFAVPLVRGWLGRHPKSELIASLDDRLAEGVALRNIIRSDEPINQAIETAQLDDWNAVVIALLGQLSLRERSYFRTLDRFDGDFRERANPERSHLEAMWNEKLRRLQEIIARIAG
jgi:hypothetical protein